jgi:hypothetical protein
MWEGAKMVDFYKDEQEIHAVVAGFEQCTTGKDEFTHLSHLTVAVYYLRNSNSEEAVQKMRSGLFRFLDHHAVNRAKYKEDLTRNWIALVKQVMEQMNPDTSLVTVTNAVIEQLADPRMVT